MRNAEERASISFNIEIQIKCKELVSITIEINSIDYDRIYY